MFLHETLIDSLSGMVLLSPMFLVFVQPLLDDGLEGIQLGLKCYNKVVTEVANKI